MEDAGSLQGGAAESLKCAALYRGKCESEATTINIEINENILVLKCLLNIVCGGG